MTTATLILFGLTIFGVAAAPAEAAPTGTCGAGGGVWTTVDVLCARNGNVCLVWGPTTRPGTLYCA